MLARILSTEPARFISLLTALLGLAVSFGLVTQAHADAWVGMAIAVLPAVLAFLQGAVTRQQVFSPAKVQQIANAATQLPPGTPVDIGNPPAGPVVTAPGD
jgi:hypothetical protein